MKFYSSLVVNAKKYPNVHQLFSPRFNREFFKRLTQDEKLFRELCDKRAAPGQVKFFDSINFKQFKASSRKYLSLLNQKLAPSKSQELLEGEPTVDDGNAPTQLNEELLALQDELMPIALRFPNRFSEDVPTEDVVVEQLKSDFMARQNLVKVLDYRKLSYINNCYSKSVVGPNSYYHFGIGAKLVYGLTNYFQHRLEQQHFIHVSGLSLVKSAVVEATNSSSLTAGGYATDPRRILTSEPSLTSLHLTEASRESLFALMASVEPSDKNDPIRLATGGTAYGAGLDWFDSDENRISQYNTVHALIWTPSRVVWSTREYLQLKDTLWAAYQPLGLPARLVRCCLDSMEPNEYDAHRIDLWLPSRRRWVEVARVSHFLNYLTVRAGVKRGHFIGSKVYDGRVLAAALVENRQTSLGKFIIPTALREHMPVVTDEEKRDYFATDEVQLDAAPLGSQSGRNYEQRRYLVSRKYDFAHARKVTVEGQTRGERQVYWRLYFSGFALAACFIDWSEVWMSWTPNFIRWPLFDLVYRPLRRLYWWSVYGPSEYPTKKPPDPSFRDLINDGTFTKSMHQQRSEKLERIVVRIQGPKKDDDPRQSKGAPMDQPEAVKGDSQNK